MKKQLVGFVALALMMLISAPAALAMGGTHGKGDPKKPISVSNWPQGVATLANRADRIGGYWINSSDWFHYAGDVKAFNEFLQQYAKIQGTPLTLVLVDVKEIMVTSESVASTGYDWELSIVGRSQASATVTLPLNGRIRLKDINVPANIQVTFIGSIGKQSREVDAFLTKHKEKQNQVKGAAQPAK